MQPPVRPSRSAANIVEGHVGQQPDLINRETAARQVAEILRRRILSGELPEGQYIRQEAIAQELGVSRLPVREALVLLETQGLVSNVKYKGALVAKLSPSEIKEIYALHGLLETFLLDASVPHLTEVHFARAEEIIERSQHAKGLEEWADLNWQFHKTLYEAAGMQLALKTLEQVLARSERYFRLQRNMSAQLKSTNDEQHRHIISLLRAGQSAVAVKAMKDHIEWNMDDLTTALNRVKVEPAASAG
jgi:DNA-binding GntR family transcriptional regulator